MIFSDCIHHKCNKETNGYGITYNPKTQKHVRIHRLVAEETYGEIPSGMVVMHTCDNRWCINPEHLRIATQSENLLDMYRKGRQGNRNLPRGEDHHITSLTETQVEEIRTKAKRGLFRKMAKEYGVSKTTIANIYYGKTWRLNEPREQDSK